MAPTQESGSPLQVWLIPVLRDNYVFVLERAGQAAVVDPAVAGPVAAALEARSLDLVAILQTHHHADHIGGTGELRRLSPAAAVIGPACEADRIPQTRGVVDGECFELLGETVAVLAVPGHTRGHIAFHLPGSGHLFCGDCLFGGGCGRLFEGTAEQMHRSLQRLAALPPQTRVWCAHEYTEANLRWAADQEPGDGAVAERLETTIALLADGKPTIPSTIGSECATNLFLRAQSPSELARLRRSKDLWRS
jgi:hydroxyacylglutathione hydrolase